MFSGQWKVLMLSGQKGSNVWWPLKGSNVWWPMEGKGEAPFQFFPLPPQQFLLKTSFFPLILLYHGSKLLLMHFLPFL
jgi:hypothetical protein